MTKHTPEPWKVLADEEKLGLHPNHAYRFIGTADFDEDANTGEIIARLTDSPNIAGNANLLAAAPDLLAACKAHVQLDRSDDPHHRWHVRIGDIVESRHDSRAEATKRIRALRLAAIAKAGGAA